jgi:hypothetical protein
MSKDNSARFFMNDDTKANKDTEANNDELWMDEEFRSQYPLTAQRLRDLAFEQQEGSAYRKYVDILRSLEAPASELFGKEGEEFRRQYPLTAQRLRDLAFEQQEGSEYRKYVDTLRSPQASAGELSEKEGLDFEFSPKDRQVQDHQENDE